VISLLSFDSNGFGSPGLLLRARHRDSLNDDADFDVEDFGI
jgi:hypothetical protein